ncbi:Holliday junction branch migration protein RuvA [Alistipes provencensis]|uniref:Holliday junction branch migration protein RuvA n=1 Tax=Alistipes provencensis TaxID=1816676 RepID=UPI0007EC616C|nr:Holliday junction branch migration protein RuvA [Alistipes provencensis]
MYEYIKGSVAEVAPAYAVIDAGGVGYYLHISLETYAAVEHAAEAKLYVHYVVREDAQLLYGFSTKVEREVFRLLISVSGVGGNTARMILSTYSPRELQGIITSGNAVLLKNVKGLGLKTAQKIIVELSGKLAVLGTDAAGDAPLAGADGGSFDEALAALVMLGFARATAEKVLRAVMRELPRASVEELIRAALKRL